MAPDVSLVLPAYNEAPRLAAVVGEWAASLAALGVTHEIVVYDDGSSDGTPQVLAALLAAHPALSVVRHENRGHGPTVLRAYREARGSWIAQADADGEIDVAGFPALWAARASADLVVGRRHGRSSPWVRRFITAVSSLTVRVAFGPGIHDVNCPFRLMRAATMRPLFDLLPADTFAPNVALSGLAVAHGLRVAECPVQSRVRRQGAGSLAGIRALGAAMRSWTQTLRLARQARQRRR
ncbi:MAG: glycosyltransferase family 2 protein [Vicinamibacterales bacterium]